MGSVSGQSKSGDWVHDAPQDSLRRTCHCDNCEARYSVRRAGGRAGRAEVSAFQGLHRPLPVVTLRFIVAIISEHWMCFGVLYTFFPNLLDIW